LSRNKFAIIIKTEDPIVQKRFYYIEFITMKTLDRMYRRI